MLDFGLHNQGKFKRFDGHFYIYTSFVYVCHKSIHFISCIKLFLGCLVYLALFKTQEDKYLRNILPIPWRKQLLKGVTMGRSYKLAGDMAQ